jgi:hypothetical protein
VLAFDRVRLGLASLRWWISSSGSKSFAHCAITMETFSGPPMRFA